MVPFALKQSFSFESDATQLLCCQTQAMLGESRRRKAKEGVRSEAGETFFKIGGGKISTMIRNSLKTGTEGSD